MRAILHIGTEKTGTTAIQSFLHLQRGALADLGFHVVDSAGRRNNRWIPSAAMDLDRHDDFTQAVSGGDPAARATKTAAFLEAFDAEISELPDHIHTVLMTSEHLHSRLERQAEVDRVGDLMEKYFTATTVVCYLRRQVDVCTSLYSTALKVGQHMSYPRFLDRCSPDNPYYDYATMLSMWAARFGHDALAVRRFARQHLFQGDLLDDFCHLIDPDLVGRVPKEVDDPNESLTPSGQALARAVNRELGGRDDATGHDRALRQEAFALLTRRLAGKGQQPSPERWQQITASFSETNAAVRDTWFPEATGDIFEGEPPKPSAVLVGDAFVNTVTELFSLLRTDVTTSSDGSGAL